MKAIVAVVFIGVVVALAAVRGSATTIRSYYIGNSVTDTIRYDDLRKMAEGKGDSNIWGRQMIPGAPLNFLWDNPGGGFQQPPYGYPTNALPHYTWDCLSLQPFDRSLTSDTNSIADFITLGQPRNSNMQVYVYSRWPRQGNFMPDYDGAWLTNLSGFNECRKFFEDVCLAVRERWVTNITLPVRIVPCGDVLYALNQKMKAGQVPGFSDIVQVYADGIHFNDTGAYVVACTYFATMYKKSPIGLNAGIYGINDTALARSIETTVWEVVSTHQYAGVLPEILPMTYQPTVPEGGVVTLHVKLTDPPAGITTVTVARIAGDTDITISNGATLVFTPANYATWQPVLLAAGEDGDWVHGSATIQCSGAGLATCQVLATERDNDASAVCYDAFDARTGVVQDVRTGYGWNSGWQAEGGSNAVGYRVVNSPLAYRDLVTKGRSAEGGNSWQGLGRSFDVVAAFQPWVSNMGGSFIGKDGTELWMSYLCQLASSNYSGKIWFDDAAGGVYHDNNGMLRCQAVTAPGVGRVWTVSALANTFAVTSAVPVTTGANLIVLRFQFGGATDQVDLFVNPPTLGGAAPAPDATLIIPTNRFKFADMGWNPDSGANHGWLDEIRFGGSFANVTPVMAAVFTNANNIALNGMYESDERSGYAIVFTGLISGTGTFAEATGLTNTMVGTISPGFSPGALVFDQATGVFVFGTAGTPLMLQIENGDLVVMTNLAAPLDLGTLDVTFLNATTLHETNWFLACASGISNEFHATNFVMYTSGHVVYDYAGGRAGVWIVPEPAWLCALGAAIAWLRRRMRRG